MNGKPRLLDQVRERIRFLHYSIRTEEAYIGWIRRIILFHGKRHPREMGAPEVEAFLSDLAMQGRVTVSTQNQALSAVVLMYGRMVGIEAIGLRGVDTATICTHAPDCGGSGVRRSLDCAER